MLITDYLDQLDIDKDTLYNNLVNAGISASQDETFTTLCPKVGELTSDLKDEFKPSINITGVNITDEPLSEYPDKLNEGLINVLNNGTDVIFNNYPNKETKEGSSQIFSDCVNAKMKIQEKGYLIQYGGTPSPDNEVPIYTVTGDNYIEISNVDTPSQRVDYFLHLGVENLYNANKLIPGYLPNSGAYPTISESWPNSKYLTFELKANQVLYIKNVNDVNNVASLKCIDKTTNEVVSYIDTQTNNYFTSTRNFSSGFEGDGTVTAKVDFIVGLNIKDPSLTFSVDIVINDQYMVENPIELCKIPNTDYQDYISRTTGKNLINTVETNNGINDSGVITQYADYLGINDYVKIQPNTQYTISFEHDDLTQSLYIGYKTIDGIFINRVAQNSRTFTTPSNAYYLFAYIYSSNGFSSIGGWVQLEKGSTATAYEPYGNGIWYVHKEVGKIVLNSTNITLANSYSNLQYAKFNKPSDFIGAGNYNYYETISDKCKSQEPTTLNSSDMIGKITSTASGPYMWIGFNLNETLETIQTKLNGMIFYYPLANATYTKITDNNLSNELEQIYQEAKSYAGRTKVTAGIIGNSAPMILETTVLKEMN